MVKFNLKFQIYPILNCLLDNSPTIQIWQGLHETFLKWVLGTIWDTLNHNYWRYWQLFFCPNHQICNQNPKLGFSNLVQKSILALLRSLFIWGFIDVKIQFHFYPRPVLAFGSCHCLCLSVWMCVSGCQLVRSTTRHGDTCSSYNQIWTRSAKHLG